MSPYISGLTCSSPPSIVGQATYRTGVLITEEGLMNYAPTRTTEAYSHVVRLNATTADRATTSLPAVIERVALFAVLGAFWGLILFLALTAAL